MCIWDKARLMSKYKTQQKAVGDFMAAACSASIFSNQSPYSNLLYFRSAVCWWPTNSDILKLREWSFPASERAITDGLKSGVDERWPWCISSSLGRPPVLRKGWPRKKYVKWSSTHKTQIKACNHSKSIFVEGNVSDWLFFIYRYVLENSY